VTVRSLGDQSTEALIQALDTDNLEIRSAATWYLGRRACNGELELVPHLIDLLVDPHIEVSEVAVEHLQRVGAPAVDQLLAALRGPGRHPSIRKMAARGLGNIHDDRALEPMLSILQDRKEDTGVRHLCAFYLGRLGDVRALEPLGGILTAPDEYPEVRGAAAWALKELGDQRAVPFLLAALNDDVVYHPAWNTLVGLVGAAAADRLRQSAGSSRTDQG